MTLITSLFNVSCSMIQLVYTILTKCCDRRSPQEGEAWAKDRLQGPSSASSTLVSLVSSTPSTSANTQSVQWQIGSTEQSLYNDNTVHTVRTNLVSLKRYVTRTKKQASSGMTELEAWKEEACNTLGTNKPTENPPNGTKFEYAHPGQSQILGVPSGTLRACSQEPPAAGRTPIDLSGRLIC